MDDVDITAEREEKELAARIAAARRAPQLHERPVLGCISCMGALQSRAKEDCPDYAACLADWQKELNMQRINGGF